MLAGAVEQFRPGEKRCRRDKHQCICDRLMSESRTAAAFGINLPVYHSFSYGLDSDCQARIGQRYRLPFGNDFKIGILVELGAATAPEQTLKSVGEAIDNEATLSPHLIELATWLADYYCQPIGEVLFQFLPRYLRGRQPLKSVALESWTASPTADVDLEQLQRRAPRQYELLIHLRQHATGLTPGELRAIHPQWRTPMRTLHQRGLVTCTLCDPVSLQALDRDQPPELSQEQAGVVEGMSAELDGFHVHLLQGITGSGKTEVYLAAMQTVIERGGQVLYLVPEIGLTPQLFNRVQRRLGAVVVASHSAQTDYQRFQAWEQFRRGAAAVMLGTRSALLSDAPRLQLIVVDEEHDASYRQQDGVRYHARDVAIKRAQMLDLPVVLGSATPSTETLFNLARPHYRHHRLTRRPGTAQPPHLQLIDSSRVEMDHGCTPQLLQAIQQEVQRGGQVLLFLNRRGYAPVVMCHACGWQSVCHQCDARLTLHQSMQRLICHHCGYSEIVPDTCPQCGNADIHHHGVGTEKLQHFMQRRFESTPVVRIDRDSVSDARQMERLLQPVQAGEPCILIGTQMLAKGHDYPNITLAGIIDVDQALYSGFYRASERLAQIVVQVAGRTGRAERSGRALLQTAFPDHPLMQGLLQQDYEQLVDLIMQERRLVGFPPYLRAITITADAVTLDAAMQRLQTLRSVLVDAGIGADVQVIGPIPALMTRRVGRYRAQFSLLAADMRKLRRALSLLLPGIQGASGGKRVKLVVEVDPIDL